MLFCKLNIKKFFYLAVSVLLIISAHSYTMENCFKCMDENSTEKCGCCCNMEKESQDNCCSDVSNPSVHLCYQCGSDISFVPEDKILIPKNTEYQYHTPGESVQISSDVLTKPLNTLVFLKYPNYSYSLLTLITVLRI